MADEHIPNHRKPRNKTLWDSLLILTMGLAASGSLAQQLPSAGSQLQQVPPPPRPTQNEPELRVEHADTRGTAANDASIVVNTLRVVNAKRFSEGELIAAAQFKAGPATLGALREMAARISDYYRAHGYFLAQAFIPPQDVQDGVVTIEVMEGRYGRVLVRNQSRLSNTVATGLVANLHEGDTIDMSSLESSLLRLSDVPGVEIRSTLTPGSSVGASDLIIDVAPGRLFAGNLETDNFGSRYTGEYRFGGTGNLNNPFGRGDVASLRLLSSFDGFDYGRAAYQLEIGPASLGAAYTALDYELGEEFRSLLAHGTAKIASLYARYPLLRQRQANLSLVANLESKQFRDELDVTSPSTIARKRIKVASASLVGDRKGRADANTRGDASTFSFTWTWGQLDLLDAQAVNSGAASSLIEGHYSKLAASIEQLLPLTRAFSFYASVHGQWSPDDLDVSERLSLGGASAVRAYPDGEAYVDDGYVITTEIRSHIGTASWHIPGQWEVVGFADLGNGQSSTSLGHRTLSGAGIGLNASFRDFYLRTSWAHRIGPERATSVPDSTSRFWINLVKFF